MQAVETGKNEVAGVAARADDMLEPLISLASALLNTDRLRIIAALVDDGPANRMKLAEVTSLSHRELLRQLDSLQLSGLVKLADPAVRDPDLYTPYVLNMETFRAARQAMGRYKGRTPRPTGAREMTLETFMPGGKLNAFPRKQSQLVIILDQIALSFDAGKEYAERDVNIMLEEINEDYCTLRRALVDYGYMSRENGIYRRNE
ncbi:MAG: DUF2087 domain-containing protein [Chloroflexi bacterium]|nr:DUF2087 domain-containing protein [Chloroflexota bacterium]